MNLTKKRLKVGGLNVCGLRSKLDLGILQKHVEQYDIIALCETKWDISTSESLIHGYKHISMMKRNSVHKYSGIHGLCVFARDHLIYKLYSCIRRNFI